MKSLRILHGRTILDRELNIKPDEKTEIFISEWLELKKREYDTNAEKYPEIDSFEAFLQKDDTLIIRKINAMVESLDMGKIQQEKERE